MRKRMEKKALNNGRTCFNINKEGRRQRCKMLKAICHSAPDDTPSMSLRLHHFLSDELTSCASPTSKLIQFHIGSTLAEMQKASCILTPFCFSKATQAREIAAPRLRSEVKPD